MRVEQAEARVTQKRTVVIADIHGCCRTLHALLSTVRLTADDTLYLLGDYIDRGPGSKCVIETILTLQKEGFDLRPVRGNHEEMFLTALTSYSFSLWLGNGGDATLQSYGVRHPREVDHDHIVFIRSLPCYRITDSHVFVHAGLDLSLDDPFSAAGEETMLWARFTTEDTSRLEGRTLVTGHTPVGLETIRSSLGKEHIQLDNGCVLGAVERGNSEKGNLVALVLESGELFVQRYSD